MIGGSQIRAQLLAGRTAAEAKSSARFVGLCLLGAALAGLGGFEVAGLAVSHRPADVPHTLSRASDPLGLTVSDAMALPPMQGRSRAKKGATAGPKPVPAPTDEAPPPTTPPLSLPLATSTSTSSSQTLIPLPPGTTVGK